MLSDFHLYSLFSGSKGNGIYLSCGGTAILIDAGRCAKTVRQAIASIDGRNPDAVFITHEHSDHIKAIPILSREVPIHMTRGSAPHISCHEPNRIVHPAEFSAEVGCMRVSSFVTPHDSEASVGYLIETEGHKIGVATDLGYMPDRILQRLLGCDTVVLESNHDIRRLLAGPYPQKLKDRILSDVGHLSNDLCAATAVKLAKSGTRRILLAHLSEENNTPELAFRATDSALEGAGYGDVRVAVADALMPTRLV